MKKTPTFLTHTDTGKFRQAMHDAGYVVASDTQIFNDRHKYNRRLKAWSVNSITFDTSPARVMKLAEELKKQFGTRLLGHYPYAPSSYVVYLDI